MKAALLPDRGVVKVDGDDARKFLNGLVTSDIAKVTPDAASFAALLTPQGKLIVDFILAEAPHADGGGFFLDCPRALAPTLLQRLNFYKLRAKVIIEDLSETLGVLAAWDGSAVTEYGLCYRDPRLASLGLRCMLPPHLAGAAAADLGADLVDAAAYEAHRIALGAPRGGGGRAARGRRRRIAASQTGLGAICVARRGEGRGMSPVLLHPDGLKRCPWPKQDPLYVAYHDDEWGVPEYDDRALYEKLILDGFQAGLSWITILRKRENFRRAFDGFEPEKIARYTPKKIAKLMQDAGIVRNRMKIEGAILSARAYLDAMEKGPGFSRLLWDFVGGRPKVNRFRSTSLVPAETPISRAMSKELARRGFKFVGPSIVYAFMQATGMVNDHVVSCHRHAPLAALAGR